MPQSCLRFLALLPITVLIPLLIVIAQSTTKNNIMATLLIDQNLERRKLFLLLAQKRFKVGSGSSLASLNKRTWSLAMTDIRQFIPLIPFVCRRRRRSCHSAVYT